MPLDVQKCLFIVLLEAPYYSACVTGGGSVCRRYAFFLSFFSLFFFKNYNMTLFIIGASTSILILLIFNFWS